MYVNDDVLARWEDPNALLVFLHCQRTGGSNLQRWLMTVFPEDKVFSKWTPDYVQWQKMEDDSIVDDFKVVGGFSQYRPTRNGRPTIFMSNIRHPFYRIVSLYKMSRKADTHFLHDIARTSSFEDFYLKSREIKPWYFHNLSCRRVAGVPDFDKAMDVIPREFGMLATTNHLHEATKVLIEKLGWNAKPIEPNGAPPDHVNYASFDQSPVREEIIQNNQHDIKLYEFVTSFAPDTVAAAEAGAGAGAESGQAPAPERITPVVSSAKAQPAFEASAGGVAKANFETDLDERFAEYLAANPGASYSEFYTRNVAAKVVEGAQHNSLGTNIVTGQISDFWSTGERQAKRMIDLGGTTPDQKVVEYGCGSLRLAAHFIKLLKPGHFFGLDIIPDFFEMGKSQVGLDLIEEKQPTLRTITPESVEEAARFEGDFVFSHAVLIHVHPDDHANYFANLSKIASKPGAILAFNAMLHPTPVRYNNLGWGWPQEHILERLPDFETISIRIAPRETIKNDTPLRAAMFALRRKG